MVSILIIFGLKNIDFVGFRFTVIFFIPMSHLKCICLFRIVSFLMDINLILKIIFRPLKISTEDFGKLWLSFANDVKQNVKMSESQAALPSTLKALQQELRLHVVDIIGL